MSTRTDYVARSRGICALGGKRRREELARRDSLEESVREVMESIRNYYERDAETLETSVGDLLRLHAEYKKEVGEEPYTPPGGEFASDGHGRNSLRFSTNCTDDSVHKISFYMDYIRVEIIRGDEAVGMELFYDGRISDCCICGYPATPSAADADTLANILAGGLEQLLDFEWKFNMGIDVDTCRYTKDLYPYACEAHMFSGYSGDKSSKTIPFLSDVPVEKLDCARAAAILSAVRKEHIAPGDIQGVQEETQEE
jgi:hypothetical protein